MGLGGDALGKPRGFVDRGIDEDIDTKQNRGHIQNLVGAAFAGCAGSVVATCGMAIYAARIPYGQPSEAQNKPRSNDHRQFPLVQILVRMNQGYGHNHHACACQKADQAEYRRKHTAKHMAAFGKQHGPYHAFADFFVHAIGFRVWKPPRQEFCYNVTN